MKLKERMKGGCWKRGRREGVEREDEGRVLEERMEGGC